MKILHCNTYDSGGGAAIAARRIHAGLLAQGVDSRFGALQCVGDDPSFVQLGGRWRRLFDVALLKLGGLPAKCCLKKESRAFFSPALVPSIIDRRINAVQPDITHLHWIADGLLSLGAFARLASPVVWTVHDTWAFTGGCHYPGDCAQYRENCGSCPLMLGSWGVTLVRHCAAQKRKAYARVKPLIVTPSKSFKDAVASSFLMRDLQCRHIPNAINAEDFAPLDKAQARHLLRLPQQGAVIAFGAISATSDARKGFDLLVRALEVLPRNVVKDVHLLIFGASQAPELARVYPTHCLGRLHDDISLRLAYSAADVFVCPSREESFSLTTLESLACGTPVAAFSVGGIPDMVEHGVNGCLATPHDPVELARGIAYILEDDERRARMGQAARKVVEERYAAPVIARQYMNLYEEILSKKSRVAQ